MTLPSWLRRSLPVAVLALLIALAYGGVVYNGYVWDDRYFLVDYAWLDSAGSAIRVAFSPLFQNESYVRPVPLLTLFAEGLLADRNPAVSHGINALIHLACAGLVYLLARDALSRSGRTDGVTRWGALALSALFAVHPALSEAVIWVSSRFDLVATLLMLLGLWVSTRDRWSALVVAVGVATCFLLAALSKESAVVFPLLLGTLLLLRQDSGKPPVAALRNLLQPRWLLVLVTGAMAGVLYLIMRHMVLQGFGTRGFSDLSVQENLVRVLVTLPRYLQLTVLPFVGNSPQHTFHWTAESSLFDYLIPILVTAGLFIGTTVLIAKRHVAGWLLLAWILCYLPVLHLLPVNIGNNTIQQRFMYLPTAVLLAFLPYAVPSLKLSRAAGRFLPVLIVVLVLGCVLVTRSIVPAWRSDLTLWLWADQVSPCSFIVRENLIWAYLDLQRFDKVDEEVGRLRQDGIVTSVNALVNVGMSHYLRGDFEKAIAFYEQAIQSTSPEERSVALYVNLSAAYAMLGRDMEARDAIAAAIRANDRSHVAIGNLLAYCDGQRVDASRCGARELERAEAVRRTMIGLLSRRRASGKWSQLCPEPGQLVAAGVAD